MPKDSILYTKSVPSLVNSLILCPVVHVLSWFSKEKMPSSKNREIVGATNPAEAAEGTLRKLFASSIGENAVHGSDSQENADIEINYFFNAFEIH